MLIATLAYGSYKEDPLWSEITQIADSSAFKTTALQLAKKYPESASLLFKLSELSKDKNNLSLQKAFLKKTWFLSPFSITVYKKLKQEKISTPFHFVWALDICILIFTLSFIAFLFYSKKRYPTLLFTWFSLLFCVIVFLFQKSLQKTALITSESSPVFSLPNQESSLLFKLPLTEDLRVLKQKNNWTQIQTVDKKIGWLKNDSIFISSGWFL